MNVARKPIIKVKFLPSESFFKCNFVLKRLRTNSAEWQNYQMYSYRFDLCWNYDADQPDEYSYILGCFFRGLCMEYLNGAVLTRQSAFKP